MSPVYQRVWNGTKWDSLLDSSGVIVTPPVTPPPTDYTTRPTGAGYYRYEDLYVVGDSLTDAVARVPDQGIVTFPEGTFTTSDFDPNVGFYASFNIPKWCKGIIGSGRGSRGGNTGTCFKLVANSSSQAAAVPAQSTGSTNPLYVIKSMTPTYPQIFAQFRVEGTNQGHNFGGIQGYNVCKGTVVQDVLVHGWVGDNGSNPGETFGIIFGSNTGATGTGTDSFTDPSVVYLRAETDGRRSNDGIAYGASGMTIQGTAFSRMDQCVSHFCQASTMTTYLTFYSWFVDCNFDGLTRPTGYYDATMAGKAGSQPNNERSGEIYYLRSYMAGHGKPDGSNGLNVTHSNDNLSKTLNGVTYNCATTSQLYLINCSWNPLISSGNPRIQSYSPYGSGDSLSDTEFPKWWKNEARSITQPYTWIHGANTFSIA